MQQEVTLYGLLSCGHCKAAKEFLTECGIQYRTIFVDLLLGEERSAAMKEVKKINPHCSFPTIVIGEKVIVGFKKEEIREALGTPQ